MTSTTSLSYSNHSLDSTLKPLNCDAPSVNGLSSHSPERLLGSDVEDSSDEETRPPTVKGNLNKWTNILHGWQERYFVLKDGVLSYYRSEAEMDQGCRGSIRLRNAHVQAHPYDDCRIDVSNCFWFNFCIHRRLVAMRMCCCIAFISSFCQCFSVMDVLFVTFY
ncbi:unnamed protein product [Schistocephalus solidus]|uniref:PH domain-containing protein n=1 Tax=Schistocephalus solidus TaxID=70667 RepID=A0A183TQ99_SCHSO|nr:unnamed protein product [Schistocephalus solidus]